MHVMDMESRAYKVTYWIEEGSEKHQEHTLKIWATTEVSHDLALYDKLLLILRKIYNRSDLYRRELEKIRGLQLNMEFFPWGEHTKKRMIEKVADYREVPYSEDFFSLPKGYAKKEKLAEKDLRE